MTSNLVSAAFRAATSTGWPRPEGAEISATRIAGTQYLVGVDDAGSVYFLVDAGQTDRGNTIRLAHLEIRFNLDCRVRTAHGSERLLLTVVKCWSDDPRTADYFLAICDALVDLLGPEPEVEDLRAGLERLASIFMNLGDPMRSTWMGLIGELVVLSSLPRPDTGIQAWRMKSTNRVDFLFSSCRLEVKATSKRARTHHVSYEQVSDGELVPTYFVSLFVELNTSGMSVRELVDAIAERVDSPSVRFSLLDKVAETLGADVALLPEVFFDGDLARSSIAVYSSDAIPAVRGSIPPGVSNIRFQSDFSFAPELDWAELQQELGF